MAMFKRYLPGIALCLFLAAIAWGLGRRLPLVGGPVLALLMGMAAAAAIRKATTTPPGRRQADKWSAQLRDAALSDSLQAGIGFTAKKILQCAVVLLGFGLNLSVVADTGRRALPVILAVVAAALAVAYLLHKALRLPGNVSILIGVGSAICGGSAIAATAPVIGAGDEEVAQSISVIFLFNVLAAVLFPACGALLGFGAASGEAFGVFAGTAINDTSSVTAAASAWDSMHGLGTAALDAAVTVKLTRTLAIVPIVSALAFWRTTPGAADTKGMDGTEAAAGNEDAARAEATPKADGAAEAKAKGTGKVRQPAFRNAFPAFILWFLLASIIATALTHAGMPAALFDPAKTLSRFLIVMAMGAIGLNTNLAKLFRTGGKPLAMGFCCWAAVICASLLAQHIWG